MKQKSILYQDKNLSHKNQRILDSEDEDLKIKENDVDNYNIEKRELKDDLNDILKINSIFYGHGVPLRTPSYILGYNPNYNNTKKNKSNYNLNNNIHNNNIDNNNINNNINNNNINNNNINDNNINNISRNKFRRNNNYNINDINNNINMSNINNMISQIFKTNN